MDVGKARKARDLLVEARIVLHRAGAEREKPGIDAEVLLAQAYVMAHRLRLAEAGQADRRLALQPTEAGLNIASRLDVDACDVGVVSLEQQRFLDDEGAVAGEGRV